MNQPDHTNELDELFDKAFEAGQDIVLLRQLENDPGYYKRYRDRVVSSAQSYIDNLVNDVIGEDAQLEKWHEENSEAEAHKDYDKYRKEATQALTTLINNEKMAARIDELRNLERRAPTSSRGNTAAAYMQMIEARQKILRDRLTKYRLTKLRKEK